VDPQIFLRSLDDRLSPEVDRPPEKGGPITRATLRREEWPGGRGHFAEAVLLAREASGNDQQIVDIALHCMALERVGRSVLLRQQAAGLRRKGAQKSATNRTAAAAKKWEPYISQYDALVLQDVSPAKARQIVADQMQNDRFFNRNTGEIPGEKTRLKWLR
jgi:hypothetical protein